jgi:chromosome partitioning protein
VLTESWLREADYHISPTKADYVSVCGLEVFRRFKALNPEMGFATNLGVVINMREASSQTEAEYQSWLRENRENNCFDQAVPRAASLQDAARFQTHDRSFLAKYPGQVGESLRVLAGEVLTRLTTTKARQDIGPPPAQAAAPVAAA